MGKRIEFFVPGIPKSKNERRAFVVGGRAVMTNPAKTVQAQRAFAAVAAENRPPAPWTGPVRLMATFVMPIARSWKRADQEAARAGTKRPTSRPDLSRLVVLIEDAMSGVFYADDSQIVESITSKIHGDVTGTRVVVESLEPDVTVEGGDIPLERLPL
jgi:Holliday junction resolvase RusA-like endonuclease